MRLAKYALAVSLTGLCACATTDADRQEFLQKTYAQQAPVALPVRSVTSFNASLQCMDRLLVARGGPPVNITSKLFADPSGRAQAAIKEMVITALSEMSRESGAFRFVDYEVDLVHQDTVQYLSSLMMSRQAMAIVAPEVYVSGAVSYIDQNVAAKRRSLGISADSTTGAQRSATGDVAFDSDLNASVVSLELHLGQMKTRTLFPGIHAANSVLVDKGGDGIDGGGALRKFGVQFNLGRDRTQGTGVALRTLVDLGMIELMGKWLKLPYWTCLAVDSTRPEFRRELYQWYGAMTPAARVRAAQKRLEDAGYYRGRVDGRESPAFRQALSLFQADRDLPATGVLDFAAWEQLSGEAGGGAVTVTLNPGQTGRLRPGQEVTASARLDRAGYLYCYYRDAAGQIAQIYPTPGAPQPVPARQAVSVPDPAAPFRLRAAAGGEERIACFAAREDFRPRLREALRVTAPAAVPVATLAALSTEIEAVGGVGLGARELGVEIESRSPRTSR